MATKQELERLVADPLATEEQRQQARALLIKLTNTNDPAGFDATAESLAIAARGFGDATRHELFELLRESWRNNSVGMRSFTVERENLPQERKYAE
jgi:hypothetical protein